MEELRENYRAKEKELKEKWHDAIYAIAEKNGVDVGVGWDMLRAVAGGSNYAGDIEIDMIELKADLYDLAIMQRALATEEGLI